MLNMIAKFLRWLKWSLYQQNLNNFIIHDKRNFTKTFLIVDLRSTQRNPDCGRYISVELYNIDIEIPKICVTGRENTFSDICNTDFMLTPSIEERALTQR